MSNPSAEHPAPIPDFVVTPHAVAEMERRNIDEKLVRAVIKRPGNGSQWAKS